MSYPAMKEAKVDIRLGTDGSASNNSLDMRAEAKTASLIQKHDHWNARVLSPEESSGVYRLKIPRIGLLGTSMIYECHLAGKDGRRLLPNLLYSGGKVMDVLVDGEALRRDGITLTVDEQKARERLNEVAIDYYSEL